MKTQIEEDSLNTYYCEKCKKTSVCSKPIEYENCPCGVGYPLFKSIIYQAYEK